MSRYEKNLGEETISVGWDNPMNTFFAQVHTNQADDDLRDLPVKLWLGGEFDEFTDLNAFIERLKTEGYALEHSLGVLLARDAVGAVSVQSLPIGWERK